MACQASVEDLCEKCGECLRANPNFDEGFCTPFWDGSEFDEDACVDQADPDEVEGIILSTEIDKLSCFEFDDRI